MARDSGGTLPWLWALVTIATAAIGAFATITAAQNKGDTSTAPAPSIGVQVAPPPQEAAALLSQVPTHSSPSPTVAKTEDGKVFIIKWRTTLNRIASPYDDRPVTVLNPSDKVRVLREDRDGGWTFVQTVRNPSDKGYVQLRYLELVQ